MASLDKKTYAVILSPEELNVLCQELIELEPPCGQSREKGRVLPAILEKVESALDKCIADSVPLSGHVLSLLFWKRWNLLWTKISLKVRFKAGN